MAKHKLGRLAMIAMGFLGGWSLKPTLDSGSWINVVPLMPKIAAEPMLTSLNLQSQGTQIRLNGKTLRGAWVLWQENGQSHLGIESMTLEKTLGIELLDTESLSLQPVTWFSADRPHNLPIKFIAPYRYLDVTALAAAGSWQWQAQGSVLNITLPTAKIINIRQATQPWGDRIVVDLDRPTLWRQSTPSTIMLEALDNRLGLTDATLANAKFKVTEKDNTSELVFSDSIAPQITVFTLDQPARLVVDLKRDSQKARAIQWAPGVMWQQAHLVLPQSNHPFGVTWLEIDPGRSNVKLAPILASERSVIGLSPMITQSELNGAIAAINGGFFNRNNQYPLGAIRRNGEWLSSPILNRGAIAWDNQGNWAFDRLRLTEQLQANNGASFGIELINSGYVKAGIARYTSAWGDRYTTITDNEVILTVRGDQVVRQDFASNAGSNNYIIPPDGYVLTFRSFRSGAEKLPVGTALKLTEAVIPSNFERFPNIMGAGPLLIKDGRNVLNGPAEQFSTAFNIQSASRSAIARTGDGKILLATLHGTAVETSGATLREWTDILVRLGARDALNLDGGGSSALVIGGNLGDRHAYTAGRVNNGIGLFLDSP